MGSITAATRTTPRPEQALADEHLDQELEIVDDTVSCTRCQASITRQSLAVTHEGGHEHTFRNPAGFSWALACYRDAPGCDTRGDLTVEATWFPGYAWSYATCAGCGRHLGWWFVGDGPTFAGLIMSRISR